MKAVFSWILLAIFGLCNGYVSPGVYRRVFLREGIPEKMIPKRELDLLARRIDAAQGDLDVRLAEAEFRLAVKKSYRWQFPKVDQKLALVNRIVRWIVTFQTQLGRLIDAFNLPLAAGYNLYTNIRTGYQREAAKYDGDFSKVHKALERALLKEAAKFLSKRELRELERRISELDQREHRNIMLAYKVTRKD
ncbi:hypothetical protein Y032_0518g2819 [Ancylostoma ceylanicum]|uniref:Uncharacterized protein n=1 Tax=Ancylostoma ceylanicum TaxID=53326 RepID=A0A016WU41_9BILA|nr:hypothetical protein Y032_0518g2819 [Ancylostoma ceylanicum]